MDQDEIDAILKGAMTNNAQEGEKTSFQPEESDQSPTEKQVYQEEQISSNEGIALQKNTKPNAVNGNIEMLLDIPLEVSVELGRTKIAIREMIQLGPGSIIELDKLIGEPVDLLVNDNLIAKGEVVVFDENFGIRITDIVTPAERLKSLR